MNEETPIVKVDPDEFFSITAMTLMYPLRDWEKHFDSARPQAPKPLSAEDREFVESLIGEPLNMRTIECFLTENTKFPHGRIVEFQWPDIVKALRTYAEKKPPAHVAGEATSAGNIDPNARLSPRELAERYGVGVDALTKRLERWRYKHDDGFIEVSNPAQNEPKYLYDESAVMLIINDLKAKSAGQKRPTNVQQKKI